MATMKSIEEKAKAYDEAIERAKEMIKAMTNIGGVAKVDDIQYLFPELKESEDELSCFECALFTAFSDTWQEYLNGEEINVEKWAKEHSKELLEVAKEELKEQTHAWSEEDEETLKDIITSMTNLKDSATSDALRDIYNSKINWLKSIKDRYTWKPSDEQMRELGIVAIGKGWFNKEILSELLEQLKKLREEQEKQLK